MNFFNHMKLFSKFRLVNWGVILLTFVLPFSRGCNNDVRYLSAEAVQDVKFFLLRGLPVLYPVFIFSVGIILSKLSEAGRMKLMRVLYTVWAVLLSGFTYWMLDLLSVDLERSFILSYLSVLILLWGMMMFGWVRSKDALGYRTRLTFSMTAVSGWFFPLMVVFDREWLIGAKLFVIATASILLSYFIESVSTLAKRKAAR